MPEVSAQPEQDAPELARLDYGPNNEELPENIQKLLKNLARKFMDEDKFSRRLEIQGSKRAHFFWRDLQHLVWDSRSEGWSEFGPDGVPTTERAAFNRTNSSVLYTTDIFKPYGLTLISVLTENIPGVIAAPMDSQDQADVLTSKASERIRKIIEHENDATMLLTQAMFFGYVDGRVHAWTRNEKDDEGNEETKITVHGSLYCKVPITCDTDEEYLYLQFSKEQHVAFAKAENPKFADKIKGGAIGSGQDVYERTARISVAQGTSYMSGSGDTLANLSTVQHTWMKPAAFEMERKNQVHVKDEETGEYVPSEIDEDVDTALELFPNGCHVKLISGEYVGSWDESLQDHWKVFNVLPGDGQNRNSMGHDIESVQERFNDIVNIAQDTYEKCIPASHWDTELFSKDAPMQQTSNPGAKYPVRKKPGEAVAESVFFEPAAQVSPDMLEYGQLLMGEVPQFLTGAFPALFGGGAEAGAQKTATGYSMQRNQAMGRMGLVYRAMKRWWAAIMGQAVKCKAALNRDMSMSVPDSKGKIQTTAVRLSELKGDVRWYPESDEGIPESYSQKKGTVMQLLTGAEQNPLFAEALMIPENQEIIQTMTGIDGLKMPGADAWAKQMLEINEMLAAGAPVPNPKFDVLQMKHRQLSVRAARGEIIPDGEMAQFQQDSAGVLPFDSTVPIDKEFDDHQAEFDAVKRWMSSSEGLQAKTENSKGFENVRFHGLAHLAVLKQQAALAPPPAAAMPAKRLAA